MENSVKGLARILGMNPDRIQEGDFAGARGLLKEKGAGRGEEGANIGADGEGRSPVEGGNGLRVEVEHLGGVFAVGDDPESGLVDGDHTPKGLDMAAPLDFREVGDDLLFWNGLVRGFHGLGVIKGLTRLSRLLVDGMESRIQGVLGDGPGVCWVGSDVAGARGVGVVGMTCSASGSH